MTEFDSVTVIGDQIAQLLPRIFFVRIFWSNTMTKPKAFNRQSAYQWYLGSAFWAERRQHIIERAGGICEKCGKRPATQVHHQTYIRVFSELPSDLAALCDRCHSEIHRKRPANDNQISFSFPMEDD